MEGQKEAIGGPLSRSPYRTSTDIMELKLEKENVTENILRWRMVKKISNEYTELIGTLESGYSFCFDLKEMFSMLYEKEILLCHRKRQENQVYKTIMMY